MLKELFLKNFKCFEELKLSFSALNILTGLNGMGKSTVMQGILLLGQSQNSILSQQMLSLKGKYVNLGVGQDVLFEKAEEDEIGIGILTENTEEQYLFGYQSETDVLPLKSIEKKEMKSAYPLWENHLYYLSAYRIEPQFLYQIENEKEVSERYFAKNGEFSIQYLKLYGGDDVTNHEILIGDKKTIADQVKIWLDLISPGVSPVITINTASRTAELKYEYIEGREKTNSYKSVNVGFGVTYVLPVVVALVSAKPGDIILLENPEAHIHPKGQRMLGELIAAAGAGGVQVIVETHSDHILNGVRISAKNKMINPADVKMFFFMKEDVGTKYHTNIYSPQMDDEGNIDIWPDGFFDEWDNALAQLF